MRYCTTTATTTTTTTSSSSSSSSGLIDYKDMHAHACTTNSP
jgi:hypothetical protein